MKKALDAAMSEEITAPARDDSVPQLVEFVSAYAREMAFGETRIGEIRLALEEALGNIIRFACPIGSEEIGITAEAHEMGAIVLNISDTGIPFNMLAMSTFPEMVDAAAGQTPSTSRMKRTIKDVEYRRDGAERKNILAWVISR
jgi:anti-sigma regulatory factor (Ser/Thr protein kinase)